MKIFPVGAELFHADGQTDMTKLIVAFRNFAKATKYTGEFFDRQSVRKEQMANVCTNTSFPRSAEYPLVTNAHQLHLPWKRGLTLGNPMRNLMTNLWIFSHVLLSFPFMTVSHALSLHELTLSHLKAAQWI
jgi:hypothetical protein